MGILRNFDKMQSSTITSILKYIFGIKNKKKNVHTLQKEVARFNTQSYGWSCNFFFKFVFVYTQICMKYDIGE